MVKKNLLLINPGFHDKEFILKKLTKKNINLLVALVPPVDSFVTRNVTRKNIIFCESYDPKDIISATEIYIKKNELKITGVITFCESTVIQTAYVNNYYKTVGLPPEKALISSQNKFAMKMFCQKNAIRSSRFELFEGVKDGFKKFQNFKSPVVIKPLDRAASEGVIKVEADQSFTSALRKINKALGIKDSNPQNYLMEEYLKGDIVSVDGYISGAKISIIGSSIIEMGQEPYFFQKTCFIPSGISPDLLNSYYDFTRDVIKKFKFDNCCFHCELKIVDNLPYLLEIAVRCPGGFLPLQYESAYQVDMINIAADIALGNKVPFIKNPGKVKKHTAFPRILTTKSGVFMGEDFNDRQLAEQNYKLYRNGEAVFTKGFPTPLYSFLVTASTKTVLAAKIEKIFKFNKYKVSPTLLFIKMIRGTLQRAFSELKIFGMGFLRGRFSSM